MPDRTNCILLVSPKAFWGGGWWAATLTARLADGRAEVTGDAPPAGEGRAWVASAAEVRPAHAREASGFGALAEPVPEDKLSQAQLRCASVCLACPRSSPA
jgi:hypothetical protein